VRIVNTSCVHDMRGRRHSPPDVQVLVVGAGPTGLALALWLTRMGVAVRIVDKASGPSRASRALGVQPRTLELHRQVGIADAVMRGGVKVAGVNLWVNGHRVARVPLEQIDSRLTPYQSIVMLPQDEHEAVLIRALAALGVEVQRRTELAGFEQAEDGVRATLVAPDGSEEVCEAAFLAGCDGARSIVRETLRIDFPGGTYSRLFYVADVETTGRCIDHDIHVELDEAELLAVFPLKGDNRLRLVGTLPADATRDGREPSFEDVGERAIDHLHLTVSTVHWFSTYRVHHRVAAAFRDRRAFLLGDAGHLHSPVGAQGMNTGIGDAVNLAWKLAAVLNDDVADDLLDTYESERIAFAHRLVATTDRVFTLVVKDGENARRVRTKLVPRVVPSLLRLPPARRAFFRTISQIAIDYRRSTLSAGAAGGVHGGDRLPWFELRPGEDNFAPLASLAWQAHVYGPPRPGLVEACAALELPTHVFGWRRAMRRVGLKRGALYLVRPDGYVGLADEDCDPARLRRYLVDRGLGPRPPASRTDSGVAAASGRAQEG
jgi:2-polyprenyl-6-methoxyphenol hydroxylase-like FAD-dependent oxidoreductase